MGQMTLEPPMADTKPRTLSVKLRYGAVELARIVAAYRNEQITDLLSDIVEPILAEMHRAEVAKHRDIEGPRKKGAK